MLPIPRRPLEQLPRLHAKGFRKLCQDHDGGIADAAFDAADIGAVQAALEGKILLGPALFGAYPADVQPQLPANVHAPKRRRCRQSFYSR